jgi:hypothetical protein
MSRGDDGGLLVSGLRVVPKSDDISAGLSAEVLRRIPFSAYHSLARALPNPREPGQKVGSKNNPNKRTGRPRKRPDRYFAEVASKYVSLVAEGDLTPIQSLGDHLGLSTDRVRDLIHKARMRHLLTKTRQGRLGGQLTPAARRLLR